MFDIVCVIMYCLKRSCFDDTLHKVYCSFSCLQVRHHRDFFLGGCPESAKVGCFILCTFRGLGFFTGFSGFF